VNLEKHYMTIKTLDNMPRILFWTIDEVLLVVGQFFLGIFIGNLWLTFLGFVLRYVYMKVKKTMPTGTLSHRIYWLLPSSALRRLKIINRLPPSHCRESIL